MADETTDFKELCLRAREALLPWEKIRDLVNDPGITTNGEAKANIMLAFRHLEDCRMRLGKAVQAFDGGTSVYPR